MRKFKGTDQSSWREIGKGVADSNRRSRIVTWIQAIFCRVTMLRICFFDKQGLLLYCRGPPQAATKGL